MTEVSKMNDQQLNRALAELMGWTRIKDYGHAVIGEPPKGTWLTDVPDYCTDPAASLDVQAAACEVDESGYICSLQVAMGWTAMRMLLEKYVARVCNATPRQRAEAAYMTLKE